jgi:plasmid stability protein
MHDRWSGTVPKNVQIRDLHDATYEKLRVRAAAHDLSLAQYLRRNLRQLANVPTMADWVADADRWRARHGPHPGDGPRRVGRVSFRDVLTSYAVYAALAEQLGVPLLTCAARLGRAHGHRTEVIAYPRS